MTTLTIPEIAALGNQLFTGQRTIDDVGEPYTIADFIAGLALCLSTIEARIADQSEAQHRFRIPGTPQGRDWNHDQHHFNSPELVTHLTSGLKAWQQFLNAQGVPVGEPVEQFAPAALVTGQGGPGMGAGGRDDLGPAETLQELRAVRDGLLAGLRAVSHEEWATAVPTDFFGLTQARNVVIFLAMHSAAHTFQLMEMQAHDDYPAA